MKLTTRWISLAVVFAGLYAMGVMFLAPISFSVYQIRLADALLPLSMVFGWPSVIGLSLGCLVSNVFGGLGIVDIVGGTLANFVATTLGMYVARKEGVSTRLLGSIAETVTVTIIVGGYLSFLFGVPIEAGLIGVLVGSIIAINIIGFPIQEIVRRSGAVEKHATQG